MTKRLVELKNELMTRGYSVYVTRRNRKDYLDFPDQQISIHDEGKSLEIKEYGKPNKPYQYIRTVDTCLSYLIPLLTPTQAGSPGDD